MNNNLTENLNKNINLTNEDKIHINNIYDIINNDFKASSFTIKFKCLFKNISYNI